MRCLKPVFMMGLLVLLTLQGACGSFTDHFASLEKNLAREVEADEEIRGFRKEEYFSLNESSADLRWFDCANLTEEERMLLERSIPDITFNEDTVFPENVKERLQPELLMELGKNPGLGLRELHERGITGKGVGIAVIDQTLYTGHPEYVSRLKRYEEMHVLPGQKGTMHGAALASLSVGESCGAAPEADLYYWAFDNRKERNGSGNEDIDVAGYARVIDRIIEVNRSLPEEGKIRVIAIARGFMFTGNPEIDGEIRTLLETVKRAEEENIFVITTSSELHYDFFQKYGTDIPFAGLGKTDPAKDPDAADTYTLGSWQWAEAEACEKALLVPMDCRTTADMSGDTYVYYADGGWSWTVPYIAGIYALCVQVKPDITPEAFYAAAVETATELKRSQTGWTDGQQDNLQEYTFHMINPKALIAQLK